MMCPSVRLLKEAVERRLDPEAERRRAMTNPLAIRVQMSDDICALRKVNRWDLRSFGWSDDQIDGWFESAMQEADGLGAHL